MKTILLIIGLSLIAEGGYAQSKSCIAGHKHKAKSHKVVSRTKKHRHYNNSGASRVIEPKTAVVAPTCLTYRKHNIVVTECPDLFYDSKGNVSYIDNSSALEYRTESSYTGEYPTVQPLQNNEQLQQVMPEKTNNRSATEIDNGTFNNMCLWDCPRR